MTALRSCLVHVRRRGSLANPLSPGMTPTMSPTPSNADGMLNHVSINIHPAPQAEAEVVTDIAMENGDHRRKGQEPATRCERMCYST